LGAPLQSFHPLAATDGAAFPRTDSRAGGNQTARAGVGMIGARYIPARRVPPSGDSVMPEPVERIEEFEALAKEYQREIYSSALRMTRDPDDAADLAQEVFVRAFRAFPRFRQRSNFRAWLYRILTNTYINECRRRSRTPEQVSLEELTRPAEPSTDSADHRAADPEAALMASVTDEQLLQALDRLPEGFRLAVLMHDVQQLSYGEIAESLRVPLGTVRSRLCRGRRLIFRQLKDHARAQGWV